MEKRDTIDVQMIKHIIIQYRVQLSAIVVATSLLAFVVALLLPKQYESSMLIRAKTQKQGSGFTLQAQAAVALLGGGGALSVVQNYIEMIKSRSVLEPIMEKMDLPPDDKEKLDHKGFAKKYLKIQNTKGSDLIEITATGRSPEEAQQIVTDVVHSFQQLLTTLNQTEQSTMTRFLANRITVAKKEMEETEQKFEEFRQREKLFAPGEQTTAAITKVIAFDKRLAELQVQNEANQIRLQEIKDELNKQKLSITQSYVADNPTILQFRKAIVEKELVLANLQQHYQEKHPSIISIKTEIEAMKKKMHEEVNKDISAGTVALTPTHGELMKQELTVEMELQLGLSIVAVLKSAQAESEMQIGQLSGKNITYAALARQQAIAQEVYTALVKSYEQTRIQEAMESMDIQVVDQASLPKKPSGPKKLLIVAFGGILGGIFSIIYFALMHSRTHESANKSA